MQHSKFDNLSIVEAGIDEAGRGPLFGRVYTACVVLPHPSTAPPTLDFSLIKDSKTFTSQKKIQYVYEMICENAIAYSVAYKDEMHIDKYNISQSTMMCMHDSIRNVIDILKKPPDHLLVDGNYFKPYIHLNGTGLTKIKTIPYSCVKRGDATYSSIAAASILAKVSRDAYIKDLCNTYPLLDKHYELSKNKGYGTKAHRIGIQEYGVTKWHRLSYSTCKNKPQHQTLIE